MANAGRPKGSTSRVYKGAPHTLYSRSIKSKEGEHWVTGFLYEEEILNPQLKEANLSNYDKTVNVVLDLNKLRQGLRSHKCIHGNKLSNIKMRFSFGRPYVCIQDIPMDILKPAVVTVQFYTYNNRGLAVNCDMYYGNSGRPDWEGDTDFKGTVEAGLNRLFRM